MENWYIGDVIVCVKGYRNQLTEAEHYVIQGFHISPEQDYVMVINDLGYESEYYFNMFVPVKEYKGKNPSRDSLLAFKMFCGYIYK